jgi:uncharacterized protein YjgD (DUF1641 family)
MHATDVQDQIDELNHKLDFIVEELAHQKRHRLEMQDLKDDLTIVAKDIYQTTVVELEEVSDHVRPGDLVFLLKKLLRNVNNIASAFDQLESLRDLLADLTPITKEVYSSTLVTLDDLDRKGYFELARHAKGIADDAVGTLVEEDLEQLRENIPRLLRWTKSVTQPGTLQALETMVVALERGEASARADVSLFGLIREMNTPEARRGLAAFVEFVKGLGAPQGAPALTSGTGVVKKKE